MSYEKFHLKCATLKESTLESRLFFFPEKESRVDDSQKFESRARSTSNASICAFDGTLDIERKAECERILRERY